MVIGTVTRWLRALGVLAGALIALDAVAAGPVAPPRQPSIPGEWTKIVPAPVAMGGGRPVLAHPVRAKVWSFSDEVVGSVPTNFEYAVTGKQKPGKWIVAKEGDNLVLAQVDRDKTERRFAMALIKGAAHKNLRLSVRAKPVAGEVEMVAGLVWRYKDPDNYYVARWNNDSVRVDRVVSGERQLLTPSEIKTTLAASQWHTLTVEHLGNDITVSVGGKIVFTGSDMTYPNAGMVGVWIKADSLTYFDDLTVEELR